MSTEIQTRLQAGNICCFDLSKFYYVKMCYLKLNIRSVARVIFGCKKKTPRKSKYKNLQNYERMILRRKFEPLWYENESMSRIRKNIELEKLYKIRNAE